MGKNPKNRAYSVLAGILREVRERQQVTQVELASRLGETQSFVSKCERGDRRLDLVELHQFCVALGYRLTELVQEFERRVGKSKGFKA